VQNHRRRLKQRGLKRVEVEAVETDAAMLQQLAKVLRGEGKNANKARQRLSEIVGATGPGLKDLLASAPLEGIRITRSRAPGRIIEL